MLGLFKKVDFVIFYEHVSREFQSVKALKKSLEKYYGLNGVILPIHYGKYWSVLKYQPRIVILPYLYSVSTDQHLLYESVYGDIPVLNLHSEQIHDETTKDFQRPHDTYAAEAYHVSWGEKFAKLLLDSGVDSEKIFQTGSIRCDGVVNTQQTIESERQRVLIPTSFSKTFVSEEYINSLTALDAIDEKAYIEKLTITKDVRDRIFTDIYSLSLDMPEVDFIFRPHPYVELEDYKHVFLSVNNLSEMPINVYIEREGSIHQAVANSDQLVCWYTSTAIDGHLMGKPVALYEPIDVPSYMKIDFLEYFYSCSNVSELKKYLEGEHVDVDETRCDQYVADVYGAVDGKSSGRVAQVVHFILGQYDGGVRSRRNSGIFSMLLKACVVDLSKSILKSLQLLHKAKPFYKGILEDDLKDLAIVESSHSSPDRNWRMERTESGYVFLQDDIS